MRRAAVLAPVIALVAVGAACGSGRSGGASSSSPAADGGAASDASMASRGDAGTEAGPVTDAQSPLSEDASVSDGGDAGPDAEEGGCEWGGAPGQCMTLPACAALGDHSSYPNECPGPASIECCIVTPSTANNPPVPAGWTLMAQAQVTSAMTTWAVDILNAPTTYPMFSTTTMYFGTLDVLARVEWHPPDFQNGVIHRGVTLYEPTD
jgi:hypothetical protein